MTDNRPTELRVKRLRELLDERGIEHYDHEDGEPLRVLEKAEEPATSWSVDGASYCAVPDGKGTFDVWIDHCTPEQAIAATLGSERTCAFARPTDLTDGCAALERIAELEELGSGTLTAEQVREAVMSADRWEKPMGNTGLTNTHLIIRDDRWQAIADELNDERDELKVRISELEKQWDARDSDCIALEAKVNRLEDEITDWSELYAQVLSERNHVIAKRDEWKTKCETREFAYKQADAERKRYSEQIDELRAERDEWKAKLANLNAELGSGTCEPKWVLQGTTQTQEFWRCECGNCGECFGVEDRSSFPFKMTIDEVDIPNFCPHCGAKVKAVKR